MPRVAPSSNARAVVVTRRAMSKISRMQSRGVCGLINLTSKGAAGRAGRIRAVGFAGLDDVGSGGGDYVGRNRRGARHMPMRKQPEERAVKSRCRFFQPQIVVEPDGSTGRRDMCDMHRGHRKRRRTIKADESMRKGTLGKWQWQKGRKARMRLAPSWPNSATDRSVRPGQPHPSLPLLHSTTTTSTSFSSLPTLSHFTLIFVSADGLPFPSLILASPPTRVATT